MRRWNLLFLMALIAAVLTALSGPSGAMAATTSTFKGKASVYYRNTPAYFVVNFNCMNGSLSGNWTWENSIKVSYSGTLSYPSCALSGPPWSMSISSIPLAPQKGTTGATLTLGFSNIKTTKTYVSDTTCPNPSNSCIVIQTSGLGAAVGSTSPETDFYSNPSPPLPPSTPEPYGTLNLTLP